ncbi:hypothetical protein BGW80DRAFT_829322 [Lactifluus volemus]|nr:hypothetical protein BGW80DRAFT_829322 [Lactifluus volemus]
MTDRDMVLDQDARPMNDLDAYLSQLSDCDLYEVGLVAGSNNNNNNQPVDAIPAWTELTQDGSPRAAFSDEMSMYSTSSSQDLGTRFDLGHCNGPVASSSRLQEPSQSQSAAEVHGGVAEASSVVSRRVWCDICGISLYAKKALNRHMKDVHSPQQFCNYPDCNFTWSSGRHHLYMAHLQLRHPEAVPL